MFFCYSLLLWGAGRPMETLVAGLVQHQTLSLPFMEGSFLCSPWPCLCSCCLEAEELEGFTWASSGPRAEPEIILNFWFVICLTLFKFEIFPRNPAFCHQLFEMKTCTNKNGRKLRQLSSLCKKFLCTLLFSNPAYICITCS